MYEQVEEPGQHTTPYRVIEIHWRHVLRWIDVELREAVEIDVGRHLTSVGVAVCVSKRKSTGKGVELHAKLL